MVNTTIRAHPAPTSTCALAVAGLGDLALPRAVQTVLVVVAGALPGRGLCALAVRVLVLRLFGGRHVDGRN